MRTRFLFAPSLSLLVLACSSSSPSPSGAQTSSHDGGSSSSGDDSIDGGGGTLDSGASPASDSGSPTNEDGGTTAASCPPSWTVAPGCGVAPSTTAPDFGPNVLVFDPSMSSSAIQAQLDATYSDQDAAQFGTDRYALLFKPGKYSNDVQVGFYTQVLGLGQSPDDVTITGAVRAKADWLKNSDGSLSYNATCNFWRGAENLAVIPAQSIDDGTDIWAVSQGTHLRRLHVQGNITLDDNNGWASGGFVADSLIDGQINSGTQQQFLTRNDDQDWAGSSWNMVFVGEGAPSGGWPAYSSLASTPVVREKPFLYLDAAGHYLVMVPGLKTSSVGHSWASGDPPGAPLAIEAFYLAKPGTDTAATMNAALAGGKHLLLTPGIYHLEDTIHVTRPGTVVMGLGLATLIADQGTALVTVDDVDNVTVAGLLLEAGPAKNGAPSPTLLQLGPSGATSSHAAAPTATFDVHCRVGGADDGVTTSCFTVNSHDVILDNTWLWRADHGADASWTGNTSNNGIIVNGDGVTAYGLFVEHFQQYQTLWNGNGGAVYFYQSEMPYDPPNQAAWTAPDGHWGYASYKVASGVIRHTGLGIGVYSVFNNDVTAENGIETPTGTGISMHHMVTVSLASGEIQHILNDTGSAVGNGTQTSFSAD